MVFLDRSKSSPQNFTKSFGGGRWVMGLTGRSAGECLELDSCINLVALLLIWARVGPWSVEVEADESTDARSLGSVSVAEEAREAGAVDTSAWMRTPCLRTLWI